MYQFSILDTNMKCKCDIFVGVEDVGAGGLMNVVWHVCVLSLITAQFGFKILGLRVYMI